MSTVVRALEFLGLSIWLGSDIFLSFVVAPGAFSVLTSRHEAGALVGYSLTRMHIMGIVCGVAILSFRLLRMRNSASLIAPAGLCVAAMILLTVISQAAVSPKLALLRGQMGSIEKTAAGKALLEEFGRLHAISVGVETAVLLAGLAALFWMVQDSVRGH